MSSVAVTPDPEITPKSADASLGGTTRSDRVKRRLTSPEISTESVAGSPRNRDPLAPLAQHHNANSTGAQP